jgi:hypothetical protein
VLGSKGLRARREAGSCGKNQLGNAANDTWAANDASPRGRGEIASPGRALAKAGIPAFTNRTTIRQKRSGELTNC